MEILKQANTKRIKKCKLCKTRFVYDMAKDMYYFWDYCIKCPVCNENNEFSIFDRKYKK